MTQRKILLLSSSRVHGYEFLHHPNNGLESFLKRNGVNKILFIPFAATSTKYTDYTERVSKALQKFGCQTNGLHECENLQSGINSAECIFIGGGNTFLLLNTLFEKKLIESIQKKILIDGIPYIGSSAGSNVATKSIQTTNDMPIIYPPTFNALNLIPFNINPHYIEPEPTSTHKGETRSQRIHEFHQINDTPVLGLPEGTSLLIEGNTAQLIGDFDAKLFLKKEEPKCFAPGSDLSFLLN